MYSFDATKPNPFYDKTSDEGLHEAPVFTFIGIPS
jgi:hypothetical protein